MDVKCTWTVDDFRLKRVDDEALTMFIIFTGHLKFYVRFKNSEIE